MKWVVPILFFVALPTHLFAQEFNAGFVQGLWYGDETVFAEQPTRIYVAIRNNTDADLTGTVEFFVDDTRIERNNVSALDGRIIESWADWTPSYGEHTISATLSRTELHQVGTGTEAVTVTSALAEDTLFVDRDTDHDGIGNKEDADDDGDGISDEDEKENGTDPLDPDDPQEETAIESDSEEISQTETEPDTAINRGRSNEPEGLEQYLTESRANAALTSITNTVNETKRRVDAYREERSGANTETSGRETDDAEGSLRDPSASSTTATTTPQTSTFDTLVDEGGFGTIERTHEDKGSGLVATVIELVRNLISAIFTLLLFFLSLYLAHPIIVQLTLLILILFIILKVARRLGRRPQ